MDRYPDDEELLAVTLWPWRDLPGLFALLKELWWMPEWGWSEEEGDEDCLRRYRLSTGGWSGNEELLCAFRENTMAWNLTWAESRRGGHHVFEIHRLGESIAAA